MFQVGDRVVYTGEYRMLSRKILGKHGTVARLYDTLKIDDGHIIDVIFDDYTYRYDKGKHTVCIGNIIRATPDWEV